MTTLGVFAPGYETAAESYGAQPGRNPTAQVTALQRALDGRGMVTLEEPGVYEINSPLVMRSNTSLILGPGVTLKRAAGPFHPMIVTDQYLAAGTAVSITSSGTTATMTWPNHGRAVGNRIAVAGANQTSYLGVHRVASVPDANTLTFVMHEAASASPATGTILAWPATENVWISGGELDYNEANGTGGDSPNKMAVIFVHTYRPAILDIKISNVEKYAVFPVNCREFFSRNIAFDTASDGIHLGGVDGAHIENIYGRVGDDLIAMMPNEGTLNYHLGAWHSAVGIPHRALTIRNVRGEGALQSGFKITGGLQPFFDIDIDGIWGEFGNSLITCFEDTTFGLLAPDIRMLRVANIDATWADTLGAIRFGCNADSAAIDQILIENFRAQIEGTRKAIDVRSTGAGTYTIRQMTLRNILCNCGTITGTAGGLLVGTGGVIDNLEASAIRSAGTGNASFAWFMTDGTISRARVSAFETLSGNGFFFRVNAGAGACDLFLNDGLTRNTNNPVQFLRAANLYAKGWKHSGSTCVNINGTGTYILRGGVDSANTHIAIAGGASVQVYGFEFRGDPIALGLATTVGQFMHSTQAGAEEGPAVRVAGGWYALAAGVSGANGAIT